MLLIVVCQFKWKKHTLNSQTMTKSIFFCSPFYRKKQLTLIPCRHVPWRESAIKFNLVFLSVLSLFSSLENFSWIQKTNFVGFYKKFMVLSSEFKKLMHHKTKNVVNYVYKVFTYKLFLFPNMVLMAKLNIQTLMNAHFHFNPSWVSDKIVWAAFIFLTKKTIEGLRIGMVQGIRRGPRKGIEKGGVRFCWVLACTSDHVVLFFMILHWQIIQNSTSVGNWTSLKLLWKPPKDGYYAGNITFRWNLCDIWGCV